MNAVVATICTPTKKISFPSNCLLNYENNVLTMKDDTSTKPFEQHSRFDSISESFESFLERIPANGKFRLVSFCSEFSIFTAQEIKDYCLKMAIHRFPPNTKGSQFLSVGFVYESGVRDFLSVDEKQNPNFELIETFDTAELTDLLNCGLEKLRRIKDSVFVLHISNDNNLFEWVVIPKTDSYIPSPSIAGLPTNEKFFYILNLLNTLNDQSFERFRKLSSIFRLVCDSFSDVQTLWVFHIARDTTFKSNATLCKVSSMLLESNNKKFVCPRCELFQIPKEDDLSASGVNDYLNSLLPGEREELEYLNDNVSSARGGKGKGSISNIKSQKSGFSSRRSGNNSSRLNSFQNMNEEEDDYDFQDGESSNRSGSRILKKPKRKQKMDKKSKNQEEQAEQGKTLEEQRAEEEERLRKEKEEEEERRKAIDMIRQSRNAKKPETPQQEKKKSKKVKDAKSIMESSSYSKISRHDKVSERIAQLRQLRENEEEDDNDDDDESSELRESNSKSKKLSPEERYRREMQRKMKERHEKFSKINILINKCNLAAKNPDISLSELEALQQQLDTALQESQRFNAESKDEIEFLHDTLAYRRQQHEQNQKDIQIIRNDYLERHCDNVHEMDKRRKNEAKMKSELLKQESAENTTRTTKKPKREISIKNRTPEYQMAVKYLEEEIEQVKIDISILKKGPNPAAA